MTYAEATVVGLIQGVTELFPVSSLGHNVLIPALIGGSWAQDLSVSAPESPYLAFIVGLHVATAAALILYFWRDWVRLVGGFLSSLRERRIATADQRLAWMIILATIPVGIAGLVLEHAFRVYFSKPVPTAIFLALNGVILLGGERAVRRRTPPLAAPAAGPAQPDGPQVEQRDDPPAEPARDLEVARAIAADRRLSLMGYGRALLIGSAQIAALLPGISRDGVVTVTGMLRGSSREDAVRFSFLLSTPVILAAGVLKLPDLTGSLGNGIRGQVLVGSLLSFIGAYLSIRFLTRYFAKDRPLTPFGIYCLVAGLGSLAYLLAR
ncbi:MAG: putative bacitracin resistance protein [Actinomycetia bacterium]|jgi:undecaprenyl-diphosphatase|nr:putative bacitracin resistance protein [Actinomycetes bacterium]